MNKVSRILGSTVLTAGLTFGGLGLAAGPAFAGGDHDDRRWSSHHRDHKDWDKDRKCHNHNGHHHYRHAGHHHGHYNKDCDHKHERVYYKDRYGNVKFVIIVIATHR